MEIIDGNIYTEHSIRTYTGKVFDLKILDPNSICIEDIAHGLSHTPRFGGHLKQFVTVAQHSVDVCYNVSPENRLAGLLHDASEAYIGDMPAPFKKLMPDYKRLESNLMKVIAEKFGFEYPLNFDVKHCDHSFLSIEWEAHVNNRLHREVWSPEWAELKFLEAYHNSIN